MREVVRFLYPGFPAIAVVPAIFLFYCMMRFLWYLKHVQEDVWTSLGRPSFPLNFSTANRIAILKFLHKRDYKKCNDPKLTRISLFFLVAIWGLIGVYVFLAMSFLLWIPKSGF